MPRQKKPPKVLWMCREHWTHTWGWGICGGKYPELGKRKGMQCRILATGAKCSVHLAFEDGYRVVTNRRGLRRIA